MDAHQAPHSTRQLDHLAAILHGVTEPTPAPQGKLSRDPPQPSAGAGRAAATTAAAGAARRPNICFVLTDDQGYGELGCHGNTVIQTPAIDALHARAVRFTDFHVGTTCAPTRAGLLRHGPLCHSDFGCRLAILSRDYP